MNKEKGIEVFFVPAWSVWDISSGVTSPTPTGHNYVDFVAAFTIYRITENVET